MTDDIIKAGIITLVRSALSGNRYELPDGFMLENAVPTVCAHHITNLVYYGAVYCGISRDLPVMQQLFAFTCKGLINGEAQMTAVADIGAAFDDNSIDYMPLKGALLKGMYPCQDMRAMGDIDILIRFEQYKRIIPVMQSLGFKPVKESDHELIWTKDNLYIELHKHLIPSYNKDYYAYFGTGWQKAVRCKNSCRYKLSDEDCFVFLFTHFAKHYRDSGIGILHFTDLWVYIASKPEMNTEYIEAELKRLQLCGFYVNVVKTLKAWFDGATFTPVADIITDTVFSSGAYGTKDNAVLSSALKTYNSHPSVGQVRYKRLCRNIFLPYSQMCKKYTFLKKIPVLLPFMWMFRILSVLLLKREKLKNEYANMKYVTEDKLDAYREKLNSVGLDFNFKE